MVMLTSNRFRGLPLAAVFLIAGAFAAPAQELVAPSEVVLYIHDDIKNRDFVQPLVCALQRVLKASISTQRSNLLLGPELRATPTQFDVVKVADVFIRTTAADKVPQSFKYLVVPYDLKAEPWRYVFATSFGDQTTPVHVGIVSIARLDPGNLAQQRRADITALRAYKLILKSVARIAGLKSPDACVLAFPKSLDELDQKSPEFCPADRAVLVNAGILNTEETEASTDCIAIAERRPPDILIARRAD